MLTNFSPTFMQVVCTENSKLAYCTQEMMQRFNQIHKSKQFSPLFLTCACHYLTTHTSHSSRGSSYRKHITRLSPNPPTVCVLCTISLLLSLSLPLSLPLSSWVLELPYTKLQSKISHSSNYSLISWCQF